MLGDERQHKECCQPDASSNQEDAESQPNAFPDFFRNATDEVSHNAREKEHCGGGNRCCHGNVTSRLAHAKEGAGHEDADDSTNHHSGDSLCGEHYQIGSEAPANSHQGKVGTDDDCRSDSTIVQHVSLLSVQH